MASISPGTGFALRRIKSATARGVHPAERRAAMTPLRTLIVENDLKIGALLAEALEEIGHVICGLEVDAGGAASAAKLGRVDLIIVDVGLGEANRIAAVEQILKEGFVPHVFVIGDGLRGLPFGPEVVLVQKPFRSSDLVAAIARTLAVDRNETGLARLGWWSEANEQVEPARFETADRR